MKIRFKDIMVLLALFVGGTSCDSFLDVQPKGEVLEGDLLIDAKGFENALYGVYAKMGSTGLYGQELSYYTLDLMAQYYTSTGNEDATPLIQYDYKNTKAEDRFSRRAPRSIRPPPADRLSQAACPHERGAHPRDGSHN